jgi:hypothetical protein
MKIGMLIILAFLLWAGVAIADDPIDNPPEPFCGDDVCSLTENCSSCSQDCGLCPAFCGDDYCDLDENCLTCSDDCGTCPASCGDGSCGSDENCSICQPDCGDCIYQCTDADTNSDNFILDSEIGSYMGNFFRGNVEIAEFMEALDKWKFGCYG